MAYSLVGKETAHPHTHRLTQITMDQSTLTHTQREREKDEHRDALILKDKL